MWYLSTIRVFVQEFTDDTFQEIAALNPLGGGTEHQVFGWGDLVKKVNAYIVGDVDKSAIEGLGRTGNTYVFSGPWGSYGLHFVKSVSMKTVPIICQTLRTDLAEDSPVYIANIELWKDET